MTHETDDLGPRLVEADPGSAAARLLGRVSPPRPLSPEAVARIQHRVVTAAGPRARLSWLRLCALASLGLAGVAGAATVARRVVFAPEIVRGGDGPARRARGPGPAAGTVRPSIVPLPSPEAPGLAPSAENVSVAAPPAGPARRAEVRRGSRPREAPPVETPAAPPPSTLAEESALMQDVLRKLRDDRDGAAALRALDEYAARFPRGQLAEEAARTRVAAYLLDRRSGPALGLLDGMALGGSARDLELAVVRGELRAEAGRCPEAESDFTAALSRARLGPLAERALYGRASCRSRRGDGAGARADLERYLEAFPQGRHAGEARRALEQGLGR
jgi:hypothetical protein